MTIIDNSTHRIQLTPERAVLAVLETATTMAQQILEREHPALWDPIDDPHVDPEPTASAAQLLYRKLDEIAYHISYYDATVRRANRKEPVDSAI
jgi:hypothetical protein